jgi:hypothetical protein
MAEENMKFYTNEDITQGIQMIQDICTANGEACQYCPFFNNTDDVCVILESSPCEWKINPQVHTLFKVFG